MKKRRFDAPYQNHVIRDVVVVVFALCLVVLAVLQLRNVLSWCGDPVVDHEIVMDLWRDIYPGECNGPVFSRLTNGKLDMSECPTENHPSYTQSKLEKYKPYIDEESTPPITSETLWARCDFGFGNTQENVLVQNVFDEDLLKKAMERAQHTLSSSSSTSSAQRPIPSIANDYLSVVVILVSSLSSEHFMRTMTTTHNYLKSLGRSHNDVYEAFHFSRFNIAGPDMVTNQLAMFAGNTDEGVAWIWEYFHKLGYLTMHGEEDCVYKDSIKNDISSKSKDSMIDVEFVDFYCDESMNDPRTPGRIWKNGASCIGNKPVHTLLMSYTQDFINNYLSVPRFITNIFQTANEPTQTRAKTMDKDLYNYINILTSTSKSANATSSPIIFLLSEQGEGDSPYFHNTKAGFVEHKRPLLYVLTPKIWLNRYTQVRQNLLVNKEKIVTPYDIYESFTHIPRLPLISTPPSLPKTTHSSPSPPPSPLTPPIPKTKYETYSIFDNMPRERTCERSNIPGKLCVCDTTYTFVILLMLLPGVLMVWWLYTWCISRKAKRTIYVNNIQFR